MGAGYDTRAYGSLRHQGIPIFELDQSTIQQHKRKCLEKAGIHEEHLAEFVQSESLSVGETFFLGSKNSKGPFTVVVEMTVV